MLVSIIRRISNVDVHFCNSVWRILCDIVSTQSYNSQLMATYLIQLLMHHEREVTRDDDGVIVWDLSRERVATIKTNFIVMCRMYLSKLVLGLAVLRSLLNFTVGMSDA